MWTCKRHVKDALNLMDVPHIHKAPSGVTCSFCHRNASLNLYYAHEPTKFKVRLPKISYQDESQYLSDLSS